MIPDRNILAEHLSGMVRCPTVSVEEEEQMDFEPFFRLHQYLKETYPMVHKTFQREVVGKAGLLYHWKNGKKSEKQPLLLAAHQDVVPPGEEEKWTYPPYEGKIADGFVWGRGALDCKNSIMGHMEALEALIKEGFQPDYDIWLAYGYNEEISVSSEHPSAKLLVNKLKEKQVRLGVVLDEGGCIVPAKPLGMEGLVANIGLAEKGYGDFLLYKTGKAGHSARPYTPSLMSEVARAVVKIEENPFPYRILPELAEQYQLIAPFATGKQHLYEDITNNRKEFFASLGNDPSVTAKFHTTTAMTMAEGSYRPNVMPDKVSVRINCRPIPGETIESASEALRELTEEFGTELLVLGGRDPSPVTDCHNSQYQCLKETIEELYPEIHVLPSICLGGTDAYYYYDISDYVFRLSGENRVPENGPAHGINERISLGTIRAVPEFIYSYLKNY